MSDQEKILIEIREQLIQVNSKLQDVKEVLQNDRSMLWKILALTICGAFALIGIKLAFP